MATGGTPFEDGAEEQELHTWSISNGSLDDRLNNMVSRFEKKMKFRPVVITSISLIYRFIIKQRILPVHSEQPCGYL